MVAIMVAMDAVDEPMVSHSARPMVRPLRLVGTTIWHPGRGLCLRSALATMPFM